MAVTLYSYLDIYVRIDGQICGQHACLFLRCRFHNIVVVQVNVIIKTCVDRSVDVSRERLPSLAKQIVHTYRLISVLHRRAKLLEEWWHAK